jgi:hypothetical protein
VRFQESTGSVTARFDDLILTRNPLLEPAGSDVRGWRFY